MLLLLHGVQAFHAGAALRAPTAARRASFASMAAEEYATVIFLRHGQSVWNAASLFTGWADVELTTLGKNEAAAAATAGIAASILSSHLRPRGVRVRVLSPPGQS